MKIKNFSRHDLNADQKAAIEAAAEKCVFGDDVGTVEFEAPMNPFFADVEHLRDSLDGNVSVCVAPGALLMELWARYPQLEHGTAVIQFSADQGARKRSRFAATGISIFVWCSDWEGITSPGLAYQADITPTVEQNFSDGQEFPYGQ